MNSSLDYLGRKLDRGGITSVEFIGTLAALTCGVVLGSFYMGINPQALVRGVLEHAELVEPDQDDSIDAKSSSTDPITDPAEEQHANQQDQPPQVELHPTSLETDQSKAPEKQETVQLTSAKTEPSEPKPLAVESKESVCPDATLAYWQILSQCMADEAIGRTGGVTNPEEWQLLDYLTNRKRGHQKALDTLRGLDMHRVDPRLLHHSRQIIAWHTSGTKLYERALQLLTDGPNAELTGPFAQSWQSSATQHRMEERLVHNKHAAVANYLDHAFPNHAPFAPAF